MKHLLKVLAILCLLSLQGCSYEKADNIHFTTKPSLHYYSNEIYEKLLNGNDYSVEVFDTNVYKTITLDDTEKEIVPNFFSSLNNNSYKKYRKIKEQEPFQIRITFNDSKYVIRVFDEKKVCIFPWDGLFEEDIVYMDNVPTRYNLYDFCTYLKNRSDFNQ